MKKRIVFIILVMSMIFAMAVPASAASASENSAPIQLSEEEMAALDFSEFTLIDSVITTVYLDEDGNVMEIEGDGVPSVYSSYTSRDTYYTTVTEFYKSGINYYVSITVTAKPSRWWVEKVKLSVLPTNGTDWMEREDAPGTKPNSYTLPAIGWYYPDGAPENVTADVKHYVHVAGEYALEDSYGWSGKYIMKDP